MKFWWVNQGKTYKYEIANGFLWSPKVDSNGAFNHSYQTMTLVESGDIVFSYSNSSILAIGVVQKKAYVSAKPNFGVEGMNWSQIGWYVEVEFFELHEPLNPRIFIEEFERYLPAKYSPLLKSGKGNQKVYLVSIQEEMANIILSKTKLSLVELLFSLSPIKNEISELDLEAEINSRGCKGDVVAEQLIMARRGQGTFRHNVREIEKWCRITKIQDPRYLRASHIKPWVISDSSEKIDGNNGLFLAPHVDLLFDSGLITFEGNGDLILSPWINLDVYTKWRLTEAKNVGLFNNQQKYYLEFHQKNVFQSAN
jgi:putative restriction endonuclease